MHQGHVASLDSKRAEVEAKLHDELSRPAPDAMVVQQLKRRKLTLKDVREREVAA